MAENYRFFKITAIFFISTLVFVASVPITVPRDTVDNVEEKYSAAPNNTPISKVYIFGRPIYIREPFVIPQRNYTEQVDFSKLFSDPSKLRRNRASYVDEAVHNQRQQHQQYPEAVGGGGGEYPYVQKSKYPLRQCYTERSGYMCCNLKLEKVMHNTTQKMAEKKACNLQKMSAMLQAETEAMFGTEFEAISAVGDFASKIHFYSDYVCKMQRDGRTILVYATPSRHDYAAPYTQYTL
ncbi:hypothetical protein GCK72_003611 [Caenorhabditis remanei]|uniref:Ground-like domain-containing protein n=1 Tax=Caenorhabditis remanei TaxID=31234 RepID=A0A6A5HZ47_CAERE|nr:hypothetical protein GCK72_003611 [Caenorhabditis remanei]KAF1771782.1 hypothetical protein GCK72_003611 [Caenorhabditis remanei]